MGLSSGSRGDYRTAIEALEIATAEAPDDELLPLALLSARLAAGDVPDALEARSGPAAELSGAALWRRAQALLGEKRPLEAARLFAEAGERFASASPPSALGERLTASCLGQAVAYLAADQLDAAQQAFSRARSRLPQSAEPLARQFYELGEVIRGLTPAEKAAALEPLVELIRKARLRVAFYDGARPVTLHWEELSLNG